MRTSPGSEHRHRVLRRHDRSGALHLIQPARINQIAERALDGVEQGRTPAPSSAGVHEVRSNGLSERESLIELGRLEDRLDAVSVNGIRSVALDRIRHEIGASWTMRVRVYSRRLSYRRTAICSIGWSNAVSIRPTGPAPTTCTCILEFSLSEPWSEMEPPVSRPRCSSCSVDRGDVAQATFPHTRPRR